jgi:SpoIIAA-like
MPIQLVEEKDGKVLEVRVSGKLVGADYRHFVPASERLIARHGKIRILFEMHDFHGRDAEALWDDFNLESNIAPASIGSP